MNKGAIKLKSNEEYSSVQELLSAHMQYLESLDYLKLNDFTHNPQKLLEKQIHYTISNMLKLQGYCQKSWSILSKTLQHNPSPLTTPASANTTQSLTENMPLNFSDNLLGMISNSIFTPTFMALNPFQLAESFASDLTTGSTTSQSQTSDNTTPGAKKKTSKSRKK